MKVVMSADFTDTMAPVQVNGHSLQIFVVEMCLSFYQILDCNVSACPLLCNSFLTEMWMKYYVYRVHQQHVHADGQCERNNKSGTFQIKISSSYCKQDA